MIAEEDKEIISRIIRQEKLEDVEELFIIEQYILANKGVRVKVNRPGFPPHVTPVISYRIGLMSQAYEIAQKYFFDNKY